MCGWTNSQFTVNSTAATVSFGALNMDALSTGVITGTNLQIGSLNTSTNVGGLSGTGSLTKVGTGTVTLQGTNSYTGGTFINAGTLPERLEYSGEYLRYDAATLAFNQGVTGTYAGNIQNGTTPGNVTISGGGTVIFTGTNSYTGGTTVAALTTLDGPTTSIFGNIANSGTVTFDQSLAGIASGTYTGAINGSGKLTLAPTNNGTVILTEANGFTGGITVNGGTLQGNTTTIPNSLANPGSIALINGTNLANVTFESDSKRHLYWFHHRNRQLNSDGRRPPLPVRRRRPLQL